MAVQDILKLAQERARAAMANANAGVDDTSVDPEVVAKREEKKAAREQRNARIVELYNAGEGQSVTEIMEETGVSRVTVINVLTEAKVYKPRRRHTQAEQDAVAEMLKNGETDPDKIALAVGVEVQYVRNVARKLGADIEGKRGRLAPEKIEEVVRRALELEEFAGVNIMTVAQYIYRLKKEIDEANATESDSDDEDAADADSEDSPKRQRKNKDAENVPA